jgi:hypothetical protein
MAAEAGMDPDAASEDGETLAGEDGAAGGSPAGLTGGGGGGDAGIGAGAGAEETAGRTGAGLGRATWALAGLGGGATISPFSPNTLVMSSGTSIRFCWVRLGSLEGSIRFKISESGIGTRVASNALVFAKTPCGAPLRNSPKGTRTEPCFNC